jgi:hypothetical protein
MDRLNETASKAKQRGNTEQNIAKQTTKTQEKRKAEKAEKAQTRVTRGGKCDWETNQVIFSAPEEARTIPKPTVELPNQP